MTTVNSRIDRHMPRVDITVERARAFKQAKRHGFVVRLLKLVLPLLAIGVVFGAMMMSRFSLMFGDGKVSVGAIKVSTENLTMVNPKLDGFTSDGGKYSVTAAEAIQDVGNQDEIKLNRVRARLDQVSGDWARVTAPDGLFHAKQEVLDLTGDIRVTSSNGMKAFLTEANIFVKPQRIVSNKPVRVEMLNGSVRSETMTIDSRTRIVLFQDRVRVKIRKHAKGATAGQME